MVYNALFLSRLNYCSTVWGFGSCDRLKIIQKKAIRNINNSPLYSHTKPICKSLNLLLFKDLFTLNCLKIYYKFQTKIIPQYFIDIELVKKYQPRRYSLRAHSTAVFPNYITDSVNFRPNFQLPKISKRFSENRLAFYIPRLLNENFPQIIIEKIKTHSLRGFAFYYKKYIIDNYDINCNIENCFVCRNPNI